MAGALLLHLIAIGWLIRQLGTVGNITTTGLLLVGVIGVLVLVIGVRNVWAVRLAGREGHQSWVYEEWLAVRSWRWVFLVALPVTLGLVGLSAFILTWGVNGAGKWALLGVLLLVYGALLGGLVLRMVVRWKLESNAEPA